MSDISQALRIARESGGGVDVPKPKTPKFSGPIHSSVAGRTDHLPMEVLPNSYIFPADIVSAMGEGNTIAGFKHLKRMFNGAPYGGDSKAPYGQGTTPYGMAKGGTASGVPIVAAGGEFAVHPADVEEVGAGDVQRGHRVLDKFVLRMRKELIKTLRGLKPPKKD